VGRSEHGPYLVFELLRGKTLDLRIEEGPLPVQEAVHIATEVARGLAHAHAEGVIHRDLKPANVFVTNKGQAKILDFGMAHAFGRRRLSGGTPAYMAPEQWEDDPEDERTDVFALGVMLYRMLTGDYPFPEGEGKWSAEPATVRKLDAPGAPELSDLIEKMLDRTPRQRPRDGAAVLAALVPIEERLRARPADGKPLEQAKRRKATFGDLLTELKRRHVFRVMVGYGIFAFAVLQVTEPVLHAYDLAAWVLTAVVTALAFGFPVAVILAWAYDLTAQGVKRTPSASGAPLSRSARFLMPLSVAVVVLALAAAGGGGWYAWKRASEPGRDPGAGGSSPSVAVLPFADLSPGHDQEYLADGLAEEILSGLAQLEGLKVLGRTTTFSFKGKGKTPGEIGRVLGVEAVLDGSVRRAGDRLRISTHLVRVRDGATTWSKTFERPMSELFAVQEEIGRAVAEGLRVRLASAHAVARAGGTTNPEALRLFLLARDRGRSMTVPDNTAALDALQKAVSLDSRFAQAWAGIAGSLSAAESLGEPGSSSHGREQMLRASERAVELAPDLPDGYVARGNVRSILFDWAGAEADFQRARALAPGDGDVAVSICLLAVARDEPERATAECERAIAIDPLNPWYRVNGLFAWTSRGDLDRAVAAGRRAVEISPDGVLAPWFLGVIDLVRGRPEAALLDVAKVGPSGEWVRIGIRALALRDLGKEAESRAALDEFTRRFARESAYQVAEIHAWRGEADAAFTWLDRARDQGDVGLVFIQADPLLLKVRGDPRYAAFLRSMNLHPPGSERAGGATAPGPSGAPSPAAAPSIAVLPFTDMSPKHDQEYFADGVAEEILNGLSQVRGLKVIGRTSSFSFKGRNEDLRTIGRKLNAGTILEGSVRKDGGRLRITAKLIRAEDGAQLWSQVFDRGQAKVFAVQEEIARAVTAALRVNLLPGEDLTARWTRTDRPDVYRQFLLAREAFRRGTVEDYRRALANYEKVLALDPGYAPAWAGVVHSGIGILAYDREDPVVRKKVLAAADKAVALAPDLPNGYVARAEAKRNLLFDGAGAAADLARARTLSPVGDGARFTRTRELGAAGSAMDEIPFQRRAVEIDPLNPGAWVSLGLAYTAVDDLVHAREALGRALEIAPGHSMATMHMCNSLVAGGQPAEALALAARSTIDWLRLTCTALAQNDLGHPQESRVALDALIAQFADYSAYQVAQVHAWRGDGNRAFEWLERAYAGRDMGLRWTRSDPLFRKLRGDPRWKEFLGKLELSVD
jgi:TolB-like protein/Flp pilus assembly protein TadD